MHLPIALKHPRKRLINFRHINPSKEHPGRI